MANKDAAPDRSAAGVKAWLERNTPALLIAVAVIMSASMYSCSTRFYVTHTRGQERILDRWTGKVR